MIIDKEKGFLSPNLNETLGFMNVEVVGSGRNNNTIGYVKVGNQNSRVINSRGLSIFLYNENFTFHSVRTFDTYAAGDTVKNQLSNYLKQLPSDKYLFIASFDAHDINPQLMNTMLNLGAVRYSQIPFDNAYDSVDGYVYNRRTPYCAIGNTNIGIVYESVGTPTRNALYPTAILNTILPELEYVGVQGYGENLLPFQNISIDVNDKFISHTVKNQLGKTSQCYKLSFTGRVTNQVNTGTRGFWVRVDKVHNVSGNIIDTVYNQYVKTSTDKKYWGILSSCLQNQTYRLTIVNDSNSSCNLTNIEIVKSSIRNPIDNNMIGRIKDNYISALTLRNSAFGMEPYYADELYETFETSDKLFNNDVSGHIYDYFNLKGINVSVDRSSSSITLEGTPSGYAMNCLVRSSNGFIPSIDVEFVDTAGNSISRQKVVEYSSSLDTNTVYILEHYMFYNTISNISRYNDYQNIRYGYELLPTTNIASTIPNNTSSIRYHFSRNGGSSYDVIFPCVNAITPKISNKSYISPTFFNDDIRSRVVTRPEVNLTLGNDVYNDDATITEQFTIGNDYEVGQEAPIANVNNPDYISFDDLLVGDNTFNDPTLLRQETTLSWSVSGFNISSIRIYKNGFFQQTLSSSTTSWFDLRLVSLDTYYQVYFLINGIYCLVEIFVPKR